MCRLRPTVSGMNTKSSSRRTNRNSPTAAYTTQGLVGKSVAATSTTITQPMTEPTNGTQASTAAIRPSANAPGMPIAASPRARQIVSISVSFSSPWKYARAVPSTRSTM